MKLKDAAFTVFDVETTGLYPYSGDRICEIGAVRVKVGSKRMKKFHALIDPGRPISRAAFMVNGITDDMVRGKPTAEEVLPEFMRFIKGSVLVAYNAGFDLGFLECSLGEDRDELEGYRVIDALRLARRAFPGIGRYNLGTVASSLGISAQTEHRALSDALITWRVFEAELAAMDIDAIEAIDEIGSFPVKARPHAERTGDPRLEIIESAIRQNGRIDIVYRSAWSDLVTRRTITPKRIHRGYDRLYLVAHCHTKNAERNFRMDCIVDLSRKTD